MTGTARIIRGNALALPLPDESVDLVVTSPPYFGLRSYQDGGRHYDGQIGAEATPREFVDALIRATAEMVRVLKPSGSIWVNLGDKYASYEGNRGPGGKVSGRIDPGRNTAPTGAGLTGGSVWEIPTQPLTVPDHLGVDHFAAFPLEWPRRIIRGWSPSGVCTACGEGRRPVAHGGGLTDEGRALLARRGTHADQTYMAKSGRNDAGWGLSHNISGTEKARHTAPTTITGYACACPDTTAPTTPAVILDPFGGTGTTALAAKALGRTGITVDMSADYCRLATWRTTDPGQLASALQVDKPAPVAPDQLDLLEGLLA